MSTPDVRIRETAEQSAQACGTYILQELEEVLKVKARAVMAISGGTSPKPLFSFLSKADFDWPRVHFFWVDERCVPPTDDQSNFKLANETLLAPVEIPAHNVHRIHGEMVPEEAAIRYIHEIQQFFELKEHELPVFDLIHRGMGPDAHTASLFPGEPLIANRTGIAAAVWVEKLHSHRVTLLPGVLLAARCTVMQIAGADKAEALHNVLKGPEDAFQFPCQLATRESDKAVWFVERPAAAQLNL